MHGYVSSLWLLLSAAFLWGICTLLANVVQAIVLQARYFWRGAGSENERFCQAYVLLFSAAFLWGTLLYMISLVWFTFATKKGSHKSPQVISSSKFEIARNEASTYGQTEFARGT